MQIIKIMKSKRLVDATIDDLLEALKPAMREEIREATDLISKGEAAKILGVKPSTVTYHIGKGRLTEINGCVYRSEVKKLLPSINKAA